MAINSAPIVEIFKALVATANNNDNIYYTIISQTEMVDSAKAKVYDMDSGEHLFTYTNSTAPQLKGNSFIFPMQVTSSGSNIQWVSPHTYTADWKNNKHYSIRISVHSASGWSQFSSPEPFWCFAQPTTTFDPITTPLQQNNVIGEVTVGNVSTSNRVARYRFSLQDNVGNIIEQTNDIYVSPHTTTFSHTFDGLRSGESYKLGFEAWTINGSYTNGNSNVFTVAETTTLTGNLSATNVCDKGYVEISLENGSSTSDINYVRLERKEGSKAKWTKLSEWEFDVEEGIEFTYNDYYARSGVEYEYRVVPFLKQGEYEVTYTPLNLPSPILSEFMSIYIVDKDNVYSLIGNATIESIDENQGVGTHTPLGSKYPVVVHNAKTQYHTGNLSGLITTDDFLYGGSGLSIQNRQEMRELRESLEEFLTNGKAKVLKEWNGNLWVIQVVDNVSTTFETGSGMGLANISMMWAEVGDIDNSDTLKALGLI